MMTREQREAWAKALRSHKFKQGQQALRKYVRDYGRRYHVEYCCLGVLCKVSGLQPQRVGLSTIEDSNDKANTFPGTDMFVLKTAALEHTGLDNARQEVFYKLNDIEGLSFDQIAGVILDDDLWKYMGMFMASASSKANYIAEFMRDNNHFDFAQFMANQSGLAMPEEHECDTP